jgi:hypothetical protein
MGYGDIKQNRKTIIQENNETLSNDVLTNFRERGTTIITIPGSWR